jgi:aminoglycoside 6'-N-acetyltransferase
MSIQPYTFRRVTVADLPLLKSWLEKPHVREWWGDPVRALATIEEHIGDSAVDFFIVIYEEKPLGYIQSWNPHAELDHSCCDQPFGTRGIDQFIGEPDLIDRGHGRALIRAFVERLFIAGAPRVVTDPNPRNARAIQAYAKAGFLPIDHRMTISGEALLMGRDARTVCT